VHCLKGATLETQAEALQRHVAAAWAALPFSVALELSQSVVEF